MGKEEDELEALLALNEEKKKESKKVAAAKVEEPTTKVDTNKWRRSFSLIKNDDGAYELTLVEYNLAGQSRLVSTFETRSLNLAKAKAGEAIVRDILGISLKSIFKEMK